MFHVEHEAYLRTNVKREIETYSLHLNDHAVIVERGTRAEEHWVGLGYRVPGSVESSPVEPPAVDGEVVAGDGKPKRRGRKPAAVSADEVSYE